MIKKHKWQLLAASLVTLLSGLIGLFVPGDKVGGEGIPWVIMGLPLFLVALLWLCMWVMSKDPKGNEQNEKVMSLVIWIIPAISLLVGVIDERLPTDHLNPPLPPEKLTREAAFLLKINEFEHAL